MKKIIRLTESDLTRIVRRVIMEQATSSSITTKHMEPMMGETTLIVKSMGKDPKTGKVGKIYLTGKGTGGKYGNKATLDVTTDCLTNQTVARITSPVHKNTQTTVDTTKLQELSAEFEPIRKKYCSYTLK